MKQNEEDRASSANHTEIDSSANTIYQMKLPAGFNKSVSPARQQTQTNRQFIQQLDSSAQKKLRYFPEIAYNDLYLVEFFTSKNGNSQLNKKIILDPDEIGYSQPDFGFNADITYDCDDQEEFSGSAWRRFMDCVSLFPKHERVQNYIKFVNLKKIQKLSAQMSLKRRKTNNFQSPFELNKAVHHLEHQKTTREHLDKLREIQFQHQISTVPSDEKLKKMTKWERQVFGMNQDIIKMESIIKDEKLFIEFLQRKSNQNEFEYRNGLKEHRKEIGKEQKSPQKNFTSPHSPSKIEEDFTKQKKNQIKRYGSALEKVAVDRLSSENQNLRDYGQSEAPIDITFSNIKDYNNFSQFKIKSGRAIFPELIKSSKYQSLINLKQQTNEISTSCCLVQKDDENQSTAKSQKIQQRKEDILTEMQRNPFRANNSQRPLPQIMKNSQKSGQSQIINKLKAAMSNLKEQDTNQQNERERVLSELTVALQHAISLVSQKDMADVSTEQLTLAHQGMKYLTQKRHIRLSPFYHLQLMINEQILPQEQIVRNAKLILSFQKQFSHDLPQIQRQSSQQTEKPKHSLHEQAKEIVKLYTSQSFYKKPLQTTQNIKQQLTQIEFTRQKNRNSFCKSMCVLDYVQSAQQITNNFNSKLGGSFSQFGNKRPQKYSSITSSTVRSDYYEPVGLVQTQDAPYRFTSLIATPSGIDEVSALTIDKIKNL